MPLTGIEGAMVAAQRMCNALDETNYLHSQSSFGHLTISVGVASSFSDNWKSVVEQADSACTVRRKKVAIASVKRVSLGSRADRRAVQQP